MSAGLCLRLVAIGGQGLFKDEIFSASYTGLSWFETIVACLRYDVHSPTYYLQLNLYRTSTRIPGGAAEMVRSCSAGERFLAAMDNQCEHATRIASYSFFLQRIGLHDQRMGPRIRICYCWLVTVINCNDCRAAFSGDLYRVELLRRTILCFILWPLIITALICVSWKPIWLFRSFAFCAPFVAICLGLLCDRAKTPHRASMTLGVAALLGIGWMAYLQAIVP